MILAMVNKYLRALESLDEAFAPGVKVAVNPQAKMEAWQIGNDIYLVKLPFEMDVNGHPMGMRWECSKTQWDHFFNTVHGPRGWKKV
jgi:hypothetical protein